ncbi:lipopolysaccharide heptosyltransferase II [Anaeromyxobacter paludicola]|uniref:lipopolysaccharide heptosyltransferase II n=1 Tax=Anaeromyxobacter paludicola TaxID=2918171 RepID=A0ABN6N7Z5_9BACT|nr:lipopolysaccharide heptosyltransferase II [Anaeromyxobacter paludicola]BDG08159.1 heptosyltransferase [Anaeromyxobacter paludicola]
MSAPSPRAILLVRYSALGDVVLATSLLAPLKERFPEARLEWVTDPAFVPLLHGLPELAAVHALHRDVPERALQLRDQLKGRFDVVVDLQNKVRSAVVARAAAPVRLVFRRRSPGQAVLSLVGKDQILQRAHATRLYAEVLAPLGVTGPGPLRIHLSPRARALAADALGKARAPLVAIAPGARWATKRWPAQAFARVADALAAEGAAIVLAGGPGDREALEAVRAAMRAPVAADLSPLPLDALAAALARVDLLVANDSGPVHLAAAVGTPSVAVFGPTSPVRWGPPAPSRVVALGISCAPCSNHGGHVCPRGHHRCLADLEPRAVLEAARELLA